MLNSYKVLEQLLEMFKVKKEIFFLRNMNDFTVIHIMFMISRFSEGDFYLIYMLKFSFHE